MEKDLSDFRKSYEKNSLLESNTPNSPITLFTNWFENANANFPESETNAMTLSTLGFDGYPKGRVVLLKKFSIEGFVFFTNYESKKSKQIQNNPQAAILFPWLALERQVKIIGSVEKITKLESFKYFSSRPRDSQLGAWASQQSSKISSRSLLAQQFASMKKKFSSGEIPLPDFWGGYRVIPKSIEFWQGRENRLHDRFIYELSSGQWTISRLSP